MQRVCARIGRLSSHVVQSNVAWGRAARMSTAAATDTDEVLFDSVGNAKRITLNRPKALNALSLPMVRAMRPRVDAWVAQAPDSTATAVIMRGSGEKAFCAGGDVRAIAEAGSDESSTLQADFFREEYELDYRLATMGVPHIALIDGITMGGGVGLSVHGSYRVATERTVFAMPETAIGFFPDVGGAHFLPRLDGELGTFLALSGHRLKGADVLYAGIATHYVKSEHLDELQAALGALDTFDDASIGRVLQEFAADPGPPGELFRAPARRWMDKCFGGESVDAILAGLDAAADVESQVLAKPVTAKTLRRMSPTSLAVSLRQLRLGAAMDLGECLQMEYRISQAMMQKPDFYEGIRAVLVDRDNKPSWAEAAADIGAYFENLDDKELVLPVKVADPRSDAGLVSQAAVAAAVAKGLAPQEAAGYDAAKPGNEEKLAALTELLAK